MACRIMPNYGYFIS